MNSCFFKLVHVHVILRPRFTAPTPIPHSLSRVPGDRTRANLELSSKRDIKPSSRGRFSIYFISIVNLPRWSV